jgi:signal transduction histidine kinase
VKGPARAPIRAAARLRQALAASEARLSATLSDLEAARRQAGEANAAQGRALAVLAHELRGPLAPALVLAHLLEEDASLSPEQRQAAAVIRRNVELEDRLVADLLDLTRIATGKLELTPAETELEATLRQVLLGCDREIRDKRLTVVLALRAADHRVWADPMRLHQILWNLLHNAVKFTPRNGRITVQSKATSTGMLLVEVADTGIGIEPALLPRIFDPFEQGNREVTRRFGGLGIGLAVCKDLVEAHEGRLSAWSEGLGKGAVFTLRLPLAAGRAALA